MNALFKSQFKYCPLVWMCGDRSLNTKINWLHEQCLQIVYNDEKSNFNELLVKNGYLYPLSKFTKLGVEILKVYRGLSPKIVNELFLFGEQISHKGLSSKSPGFIQFLVVLKDIFVGLGFFNKKNILRNGNIFFFLSVCLFYFISLYE